MSVSNIILWSFILGAAVVIDMVLLPRFMRTPLGAKIGSMLANATVQSEQEISESETQFLPDLQDAIHKIQGWFKRKTESRLAQKGTARQAAGLTGAVLVEDSARQIHVPADSVAEIPVSTVAGQTNILVFSSEGSDPGQTPINITPIETPTRVEEPGTTNDSGNITTTQPKSHIQIDVSLAPGEIVRITVESKAKK